MATALVLGLVAAPAAVDARAKARTTKPTKVVKKKAPAPTAAKDKATGAIGRTRAVRGRTAAASTAAAAPTTPTPQQPTAERRLTRDQRFSAAKTGARKAMKPFAGGGLDIEALVEREQIQLTPGSSFLGRGPVRVIIRPKVTAKTTRWERWTRAFRPNHNRRVLMSVSETGIPSVMDDEPDAIQHRIWRRFNGLIPIGEITRDVIASDKAKAGLVGGVGGLFTATINPAVAVGVGLVALRYISKGVQERRAARKTALDSTAEFIRQKEAVGETPAVSVAYRFYEGEMEEAGSRPISKDAFIEQMSYRLGKPVKAGSSAATPPAPPAPAPAPAAPTK